MYKNFITSNKKYKKIAKKFLSYETNNMQPNIKIQWKNANNFILTDRFGDKFIDFTSGIFAANIGHKNKSLIKKISEVMHKGIFHSYNFYNYYREEYILKLIKFINQKKLNKCHLVSSGTEATETALKLVRTYGKSKNKNKIGIICIGGNYHGRTIGSQMLSGKNKQSEWIGYFDKNIYHINFPYPWKIKKINAEKFFYNSLKTRFKKNFNFEKKITSIFLETFQGWGAVFYPKNYVKAVEKFCKKNKILLCFDEMQSGFARTGKKFGFEHYNVIPDLICCGKGMGSGMPLAGVVTSNKIMNNPLVSGLTSTHSANPIVCAAGTATIDEINKRKLVKKSYLLGKLFHQKLQLMKKKYSEIIFETLGVGLIGSVIFKDYKGIKSKYIADYISQECLSNGLLICNTGRESIKLGPPLTISTNGIEKALKILDNAINKIRKL